MEDKFEIVQHNTGDYFVVEIYERESGHLCIRIGYDHPPAEDEIALLLRDLESEHSGVDGGGEPMWQF